MVERNYPRIGERVFEETLPNGLRIRVIEKPHHAKACAFFVTRYGGMDLRFQLGGVALHRAEAVRFGGVDAAALRP